MSIELRTVDTSDERALRSWWEVGHAAEAERVQDVWPAWEVSRRALPTPHPERDVTLVTAYDGGTAVGASMTALPTKDNEHLAFVELWVRPERRREGIGSLLAADLDTRVRESGRDTLLAEAMGRPGEAVAGHLFAVARGYELVNEEQEKVLDLTTAPATWGALDDEVAQHLGDYRIETCDTVIPDHLIGGLAQLLSSFYEHVPLGETDLRDSEWTVERMRAHEAHLATVGRTIVYGVALAPDGTVVGMNDVRVSHAAPESAEVGLTIVSPEHRGHRLGLAVKLASHRRVLADFPDCVRARTCNAISNTAMNDVNARMGYVVVEQLLELQKRLG